MESSAISSDRRLVAVILGAALWKGGVPSDAMRRRTAAAAQLWQRGGVDLIIPSGGRTGNGPAEAEVMRSLLLASGVPSDAIQIEPKARTTWETARYVSAMISERDALLLVSDGYHLPRCKLAFRAFGIHTEPSPEPVRARRSWALLRQSLREVPAFALYLIRFARLSWLS